MSGCVNVAVARFGLCVAPLLRERRPGPFLSRSSGRPTQNYYQLLQVTMTTTHACGAAEESEKELSVWAQDNDVLTLLRLRATPPPRPSPPPYAFITGHNDGPDVAQNEVGIRRRSRSRSTDFC